MSLTASLAKSIIGEPEVVEDDRVTQPLVEDGRPVGILRVHDLVRAGV